MKNLRRNSTAIAITAMIAFGGCVSPKIQQAQQGLQQISAECSARLAAPQFELIRAKVTTEDDRQSPIDKLANRDVPSPAERQVILAWARIRSECRGRSMDFIRSQNLNIPAVDFMIAEAPKLDLLAATLATGDISYGEYNRRFLELSMATHASANAISAEQQQREAATNAAAAAMLGAGMDMFLAGQQMRAVKGR